MSQVLISTKLLKQWVTVCILTCYDCRVILTAMRESNKIDKILLFLGQICKRDYSEKGIVYLDSACSSSARPNKMHNSTTVIERLCYLGAMCKRTH